MIVLQEVTKKQKRIYLGIYKLFCRCCFNSGVQRLQQYNIKRYRPPEISRENNRFQYYLKTSLNVRERDYSTA